MADVKETIVDTEVDADAKLSNLVNSAVTSQLKRHMKGLGDQFGTMLDERFAAFKPAAPAAPVVEPAKGAAAPAADAASGVNDEVAQLRADLKATKLRAVEKEVYADVRSLLAGKVRPEAMDTAIKLLKASGQIKINSRTEVASFKIDDAELDLKEGLTEWLAGEGALFAPALAPARRKVNPANGAPQRGVGGGDGSNLTSAQKASRALAAKGLVLDS